MRCFITLTTFPGALQYDLACSKHDSTRGSQISKRDLCPPSRSADKWPRFSFVVFGDYKSRRVIVRQLHCIIMCLIRVWGSPSQHRTSRRCISAYSSQQKKSVAKSFAPPLLSIKAPCLATPMPSEGQGQRVSWGGATTSSCNTNYCAGVIDASRVSPNLETTHTYTCRAVIMMHVNA